jgi:hypothetical protein
MGIPRTADLWVYFMIHSLKFLKPGGQLAAILPWSFLYADYAKPLRAYLSQQFRHLHCYVVGQRVFARVEERVLIVLGMGFGSGACQVAMHYSEQMPNLPVDLTAVLCNEWVDSPRHAFVPLGTVDMVRRLADRIGFHPLRQYANIRIGTVTGANSFFVLGVKAAADLQLPSKHLMPVIRHSRQLSRLHTSDLNGTSEVLVTIAPDVELAGPLIDYVEKGRKVGLHARYHTRKRQPWYSIPTQKAPEAFLPYMTKEVPFLVRNTESFLSTNTIHHVNFFPSVTEEQKNWIQLSMLTSISQLSTELAARTYGGGVLKIEPSAAGAILVCPTCDQEFPEHLLDAVDSLLAASRRLEAVDLVDNWFRQALDIEEAEMELVRERYRLLRQLRLGREPDPSTTQCTVGVKDSH